MSKKASVVVIYHSGYGHTKKLAEAVAQGVTAGGAQLTLISIDEMTENSWDDLDAADGIIFGCPTYMGGVSAQFKEFADKSSKPWGEQKWKDKIAAGFTNSGTINGDKFSSIQYIWTLSQQHGMIWVGTGLLPANKKESQRNDINYLGGFGGLLGQSPVNVGPEEGPLPGDLATGKIFGKRVAVITAQFARGKV